MIGGDVLEKCSMDCLNCQRPFCKYDEHKDTAEIKREKKNPKKQRKKVEKSVKEVTVKSKRGRPKKYTEGTYWENYSREHRAELNAKERERYMRKHDEILEKKRIWREEHREYIREYNRKRRDKYRDDSNTDRSSQSIIR